MHDARRGELKKKILVTIRSFSRVLQYELTGRGEGIRMNLIRNPKRGPKEY